MADLNNLKKLTSELSTLVKSNPIGFIRYDVGDTGDCIGINLLHLPEVAIQKAYLSKGTYFKDHIHKDEVEIMTIYKGKLKGYFKESQEEVILNVGDAIKSEKGIPHSWTALEDTWLIAITIPASGAYPNG